MKHNTVLRSLTVSTLALGLSLGALSHVSAASAATLAPRMSDLKLANGGVWKGDVGAQVRATYMVNGKEVSVEGKVVKLDKSLVVLEVTEGAKLVKKTILSLDLKKMETLTAAASGTPAVGATTTTTTSTSVNGPGKSASTAATAATTTTDATTAKIPSVFVLPWEGTVGIGARHDEIEMIGKEADKLGPGQIIVLEVNSPGGLVTEGDKINVTLTELKKRHRVVAWIKKAISAAAFTSLHCDEIYFMRVGALGSITMFAGQTAISGAELQAWLKMLGEVCELGGRPAIVGQAMVTNPILCSYDRDEEGNITWYETLEGKYDLSDEKQNLTLNCDNALHCKFSDGTADTVEELAACMQLKEWKEASDVGRKIHEDWQRTLKQCEEIKPLLLNDYQNPGGTDAVAQLGNQIKAITEILKWYDRCYPGMVYEAPNLPPEKKPLQDELEALKKRLGNIKRNQR